MLNSSCIIKSFDDAEVREVKGSEVREVKVKVIEEPGK